jgi:hypothetical protein
MTRPQGTSVRTTILRALLPLTLVVLDGCGGHRELELPAVGSLWSAAQLMIDQVDETDGPPKWVKQTRFEDRLVFGLGVHRANQRPERDLYYAMRDAKNSIGDWLDEHELPPPRLLPPLAFDLTAVRLEKLAFDREGESWYVLAFMDLEEEADRVAADVAAVEEALIRWNARIQDEQNEFDDRLRAALAMIYDLERHEQYRGQYRVLAGEELETPNNIDVAVLQDHADDVLSDHGVRILVDGNSSADLYADLHASVMTAMGEVHIGQNIFGEGSISISLNESPSRRHGFNYLELGGEIQMNIEGGDARSYTVPLRVIGMGSSLDEARFRASRLASKEVAQIVRVTLLRMAKCDG